MEATMKEEDNPDKEVTNLKSKVELAWKRKKAKKLRDD